MIKFYTTTYKYLNSLLLLLKVHVTGHNTLLEIPQKYKNNLINTRDFFPYSMVVSRFLNTCSEYLICERDIHQNTKNIPDTLYSNVDGIILRLFYKGVLCHYSKIPQV